MNPLAPAALAARIVSRSRLPLAPLLASLALAAGCGAPAESASVTVGEGTVQPLSWCPVGEVQHCTLGVCTCQKVTTPPPPKIVSLATLANGRYELASDATNLYWTGEDGLFQCAKAACDPITLYSGDSQAESPPMVDATNVYWVENTSPPRVLACAIGGCGNAPTVVAVASPGPTGFLAMDDTNLYWADLYHNEGPWIPTQIWSCPKTGCGSAPTKLVDVPGVGFGMMVVNDGTLYWGSPDGYGILTCPTTGCATPGSLYTGLSVKSVAIGNGVIYGGYFQSTPTGGTYGIAACSVNGCGGTPTTFGALTGDVTEGAIVVDTANVYWISETLALPNAGGGLLAGTINVCPVPGCAAPKSLVTYSNSAGPYPLPTWLAVDGSSVYFPLFSQPTTIERLTQ